MFLESRAILAERSDLCIQKDDLKDIMISCSSLAKESLDFLDRITVHGEKTMSFISSSEMIDFFIMLLEWDDEHKTANVRTLKLATWSITTRN